MQEGNQKKGRKGTKEHAKTTSTTSQQRRGEASPLCQAPCTALHAEKSIPSRQSRNGLDTEPALTQTDAVIQ